MTGMPEPLSITVLRRETWGRHVVVGAFAEPLMLPKLYYGGRQVNVAVGTTEAVYEFVDKRWIPEAVMLRGVVDHHDPRSGRGSTFAFNRKQLLTAPEEIRAVVHQCQPDVWKATMG